MTTQKEWTEKAMRQGDALVLLEYTDKYIERLRQGEATWRDLYREMSWRVDDKQSDTT